MSLILNLSVLVASQLMSDWLHVLDLCRLESAFGSVARRLHLMFVYERVTTACSAWDTDGFFENEVEWIIARKIKASSLCLEDPMSSCVAMKITTLLFHSKLYLKHLSINGNKHIFEIIIPCIVKCCDGIRCLELTNCTTNIRPLLMSLKRLSELYFRDCEDLVFSQFENITCPSVRKLVFSGNISGSVQVAIWNMCPHLVEYSRFNGNVHVSKQIRPLTVITLFNSVVQTTEEFAATLVSVSKITVRFSGWGHLWFPQTIKSSSNYTYVDFSSNDSLNKESLQAIGASPSCKTLQSLNIARCLELRTSTLRYICTKCSALKSLDISANVRLRSDACEIVLQCLPQLHTLKANCMWISDRGCDAIAASNLFLLEVVDTFGFTDNGIITLMNGCNSLQKLHINDFSVTSLVRKLWKEKAPGLQILSRYYECGYEYDYE